MKYESNNTHDNVPLQPLRTPAAILLAVEALILVIRMPVIQELPLVANIGGFLMGLIVSADWSYGIWAWFNGISPVIWWIMGCIPPALLVISFLPKGTATPILGATTGLEQEYIDRANQRLQELLSQCDDPFPVEPGVRIQVVSMKKEMNIVAHRQDYILPWNSDGEIYLNGLIEGHIHLILMNNVAYIHNSTGLTPLTRNVPMAISRKNRAGELVCKCYITWLGGK